MDDLREFLRNEDGTFPGLADLPYWWDQIPADAVDPDLPNYRARDMLVWSYWNWAFSRPWAGEGLRRLLITLRERGEPIPDSLQQWAVDVASGRREQLDTGRGRPREDERNARIMHAFRVLRNQGFTQEQALKRTAGALFLSEETIRSTIRRVKRDRPFR